MKGYNRRRVLGTLGIVAGGTAIGINHWSEPAKADVSVDGLSIEDKTHVSTSEPSEVTLEVDAEYTYTSEVAPDEYTMQLLVGSIDARYPIADETSSESLGKSESGSETLSGSLTGTPAFSINQFSADRGEITHNVAAKLQLELYHSGETIATAEAEDTFQIRVVGDEIDIDASIAGVGTVEIG